MTLASAENQLPLRAGGFVLAPLCIGLMWLDLLWWSVPTVPLAFFVVLPLARWVWPLDLTEEIHEPAVAAWWGSLLCGLPAIFALCWLASALAMPFLIELDELSGLRLALAWLSVWIVASLGLAASHELTHRAGHMSLIGRLLGASIGVFAFHEEHRMHHARSGHGRDPDCAPQDESIYAYTLRTTREGFWSAWEFETARLIRTRRKRWANRIVWTGALTLGFCALWAFALGASGALFFISSAAASIFSLRAITFIQHWGLRDVPMQTGGLGVSWVSTCLFQSWLTFNLTLHEHHHAHPGRPYWRLRSQPTDLQLPITYPLAFLLSLAPSLYRRVMSERLAQWLEAAKAGRPVRLPATCIIR